MTGYNGHSKSNNAITAEKLNRFPASVLAKKLKIQTGAVKALMQPCEWHHSSKHFNQVDYYDGDLLLMLANDEDIGGHYDQEDIQVAAALLAALDGWKPPKKDAKTWTDCTVKWLEWGGTQKHPTATEETGENCTVEWKGGKFCLVRFPNGGTMRKGTDTRGFDVRDQDGGRVYF